MKLAVFAGDDKTWFLPSWDKALERLAKQYEIAGIYVFPDLAAGCRGPAKFVWYLDTFGLKDVFLLALYGLKQRWNAKIRSWPALAKKYKTELRKAVDPNAPEVASWVKRNQVDIVLVSLNQILEGDILKAARKGILNKHAAILPAARGVLPFLSCIRRDFPLGVTFHLVSERIDAGPYLAQWRYTAGKPSLVRFYADVYEAFPQMLEKALARWIAGSFQAAPADAAASYFGWPKKEEVTEFRHRGGVIARWRDLFYSPAVHFEELAA